MVARHICLSIMQLALITLLMVFSGRIVAKVEDF